MDETKLPQDSNPDAAANQGGGPAAAPAATGDYAPVSDFDRETVEMKKELEPAVYDKVMSDLNHVVWAYGIIFALFAAYAVFLWRKASANAADVEALKREIAKRNG